MRDTGHNESDDDSAPESISFGTSKTETAKNSAKIKEHVTNLLNFF